MKYESFLLILFMFTHVSRTYFQLVCFYVYNKKWHFILLNAGKSEKLILTRKHMGNAEFT